MGVLVDSDFKKYIKNGEIEISDFSEERLNPNSYNLRLGKRLLVYKNDILDMKVKNETEEIIIPEEGYVLYPGQLYLGETMETTYGGDFIPLVEGRSSTGRLGINIHATAGWGDVGFRGKWTLEISVIKPVRVYPGVEICQYVLETGEGKVEHRYHGKYQNQDGVIASRINLDFK